jgi:2'-5' RNA ligase
VVAFLRQEEINVQNREIKLPPLELIKPGRIPEIPEWYYDLATNSILNGGINPKGTPPTSIPFERIKEILKEGLSETVSSRKPVTIKEAKYFMEVRVPLEIAKRIREMIESQTAGVKLHLPENYHITLIYLGDYDPEEVEKLIEKVSLVLEKIKPFSIEINSKNLKVGQIPGYQTKTFYFLINEERGGKELRKIRLELEKIVPRFQPQEFFPHLTIASAIPSIEKKVIREAKIKFKKEFKISFLVEKIRLTGIVKKPTGQTVYESRHYFLLTPKAE